MNNKKPFFQAGTAGIVLGTALLMTLTGCVGYVDEPRAGVYVAPAGNIRGIGSRPAGTMTARRTITEEDNEVNLANAIRLSKGKLC
jgi:hypothetical protein